MNSVFTTVTYKEKREYDDSIAQNNKEYIKSLCQEFNADIQYITVVELQERGIPHLHIILIFPFDVILNFDIIMEITEKKWKWGNARTEPIFDVKGLAKYLKKDYDDPDAMKKFPKGKKKYYTSRNIGKKEKKKINGAEANRIMGDSNMNTISQQTIYIHDDDSGFFHEIKQYVGVME